MERKSILQRIQNNDPGLDTVLNLDDALYEIQDVFSALKRNNRITKFILRFTSIYNIECDELSSLLENNDSLTELDLSSNNIKGKLTNLRDGLIKNRTLVLLDLSNNDIGDEAIKGLSEALKFNRTLKTLNLNYLDNLTNEGIKYLFQALEENHTLTELMIERRRLSNMPDINRIEWLIEQNNKICLEKDPIIRNNLVAEKTTNTVIVPTLLEIGLFAVKQQKEISNEEKYKLLLKEITEKIENNPSHFL